MRPVREKSSEGRRRTSGGACGRRCRGAWTLGARTQDTAQHRDNEIWRQEGRASWRYRPRGRFSARRLSPTRRMIYDIGCAQFSGLTQLVLESRFRWDRHSCLSESASAGHSCQALADSNWFGGTRMSPTHQFETGKNACPTFSCNAFQEIWAPPTTSTPPLCLLTKTIAQTKRRLICLIFTWVPLCLERTIAPGEVPPVSSLARNCSVRTAAEGTGGTVRS